VHVFSNEAHLKRLGMILTFFNATEVDLLRHVYKLIEKASQKMKVVGKLVWLSTKCPSQTAEVLSSLEVSSKSFPRSNSNAL
jgi:hypothetical protein